MLLPVISAVSCYNHTNPTTSLHPEFFFGGGEGILTLKLYIIWFSNYVIKIMS